MATAIETRIQQLDDAIDSIITGGAVREYEINGRSVARYKLSELIELRKDLLKQKAAGGGGSRNYVDFDSPGAGVSTDMSSGL
jgi:hypothetical protein